jgi:hypothetical protein
MADELREAVRVAGGAALAAGRAGAADRRSHSHFYRPPLVGIYEVTPTEVVNLAWSGPAPPAYPRFSADQGLTGVAIKARETVI